MKKSDVLFDSLRDREDEVDFGCLRSYILFKLLPVLTCSLLTGILSGFFIGLFSVEIDILAEYSSDIYSYFTTHIWFAPLLALSLAALGVLMWFLLKWLPEARGSGVPRAEAMARGHEKCKSYRLLLGTYVGTAITTLAGLSVGIEGPSVQLGAGLGSGVGDVARLKGKAYDYTVTAGTAAGFSVAFSAPLAGIVFALEDVRRAFSPLAVAASCVAVVGAGVMQSCITSAVGFSAEFLSVSTPLNVPLENIYMFVLLGLVVGAFALLFRGAILSLQQRSKKSRIPSWIPVVLVFVLSAIVGVLVVAPNGQSLTSGSGLALVDLLLGGGYGEMSWELNIVIFFIKFALIMLCFRSKVTGGMMVPMLTLGALIGGCMGDLFVFLGLPEQLYAAVVVCGMAAFFGASISAPFTAVVIFVETLGWDAALPVMITVAVATLVTQLFQVEPLYDRMIEIDYLASLRPRFLRKRVR